MQIKIDKHLIQESMILFGPSFIPGIQSNHAQQMANSISNKKELDDFKKDYSGYANYKTYNDTPHMMKRGVLYGGGMAGSILGGLTLNSKMNDTNTDDDFEDIALPLTGLAGTLGAIGGAASGLYKKHISKDQNNLNNVIRQKEKTYK